MVKRYQWYLCSFSSFFLQRFKLKMFLNTTTFDTNTTPIPVDNMSTFSRSCSAPLMGFFRFVSTVGFPILRFLLLHILFRHLHEILPLVPCHHQWVLHLDAELLLDLQTHCSAIPVSRLLTHCLKILLGISHTVGFFRLHFSVQIEIGSAFLEVNWNELVLSILVQQFLPDQF